MAMTTRTYTPAGSLDLLQVQCIRGFKGLGFKEGLGFKGLGLPIGAI